jgi:hypothetical protein
MVSCNLNHTSFIQIINNPKGRHWFCAAGGNAGKILLQLGISRANMESGQQRQAGCPGLCVMQNVKGEIWAMPATLLGWLAVGLTALFSLIAIFVISDIDIFPGFQTLFLGVIAGITTLLAIIWQRERSWLVWLALLPGLFAFVFALGEILSPH